MKITLDKIPLVNTLDENHLNHALKVKANGVDALIFISIPNDEYSEEKIVIIWDKKVKGFDKIFTTKYFYMDNPGLLNWGFKESPIELTY